jgi:hypothetical protein
MTLSLTAYQRIWSLSLKSMSVCAGVAMAASGSDATAPFSKHKVSSSTGKGLDGVAVARFMNRAYASPCMGDG